MDVLHTSCRVLEYCAKLQGQPPLSSDVKRCSLVSAFILLSAWRVALCISFGLARAKIELPRSLGTIKWGWGGPGSKVEQPQGQFVLVWYCPSWWQYAHPFRSNNFKLSPHVPVLLYSTRQSNTRTHSLLSFTSNFTSPSPLGPSAYYTNSQKQTAKKRIGKIGISNQFIATIKHKIHERKGPTQFHLSPHWTHQNGKLSRNGTTECDS